MPGYYDSQQPSNSLPVSRDDVEYVKGMKAKALAQRAPGMAPQFSAEQDDYNMVDSVPRERMDNAYNRVLRGADAGPLSQGSRRAQTQERESIWSIRDEANQNKAKANAFSRRLSSRDIEWQTAQQDRARQQQLQDRALTIADDDRKYSRDRDAVNDQRSDKAQQLTIATAMMNSPDEMTRLQGQELFEQLNSGGGLATSSGGGGQAATSAALPGATASSGSLRGQKVAALLAKQKADTEYQAKVRSNTLAEYDRGVVREQSKYDDEQRQASTKSERTRLEARINDPSRHPNDRANDERRLAALDTRESSPSSFQGGLINGRVQNAFNNSVNKATDLASDTSFTPSKDSINRFELGEKQKALENMSQGHELIKRTMATDPELVSAIDSAREDISRIQREGGSAKLNRWMSNVMKTPLRAIGFNDPYKDFELNDPQVKWVKETADYLTKLVAAKTGQDPKLVRSLIMADLRGSTAGDEPAAVQVKNALR